MNKINKNQAKGISKQIRRNSFEQTEFCVVCLQETDISHLNIVTGVCLTCRPNNFKKLNNKKIKDLVGLYDTVFSKE
jgi:hypothetical protein